MREEDWKDPLRVPNRVMTVRLRFPTPTTSDLLWNRIRFDLEVAAARNNLSESHARFLRDEVRCAYKRHCAGLEASLARRLRSFPPQDQSELAAEFAHLVACVFREVIDMKIIDARRRQGWSAY